MEIPQRRETFGFCSVVKPATGTWTSDIQPQNFKRISFYCGNRQTVKLSKAALGLFRPRQEAATLHPRQEIRNLERIDSRTSFSSVSPRCTRVRRARGWPFLPTQHARPTFKIKTSQSQTSMNEEKLVRMNHMTLDLRHKTQMLPLNQVSKATHFLSTGLTQVQRFPETSASDFVSQP